MRALWVFAGVVCLAAGCAVPGGQAASGEAVEARPSGAQPIHVGPRGGCYKWTKSGKKRYVDCATGK